MLSLVYPQNKRKWRLLALSYWYLFGLHLQFCLCRLSPLNWNFKLYSQTNLSKINFALLKNLLKGWKVKEWYLVKSMSYYCYRIIAWISILTANLWGRDIHVISLGFVYFHDQQILSRHADLFYINNLVSILHLHIFCVETYFTWQYLTLYLKFTGQVVFQLETQRESGCSYSLELLIFSRATDFRRN